MEFVVDSYGDDWRPSVAVAAAAVVVEVAFERSDDLNNHCQTVRRRCWLL